MIIFSSSYNSYIHVGTILQHVRVGRSLDAENLFASQLRQALIYLSSGKSTLMLPPCSLRYVALVVGADY